MALARYLGLVNQAINREDGKGQACASLGLYMLTSAAKELWAL
jgi:hypothetical protein